MCGATIAKNSDIDSMGFPLGGPNQEFYIPFESIITPQADIVVQLDFEKHQNGRNALDQQSMHAHLLKPKIRTPAPTMMMPNHSLEVGRSCKKIAAKIATSSRLNLSTGATFEAAPTFKARK